MGQHEIVKTTDPLPIWYYLFKNSTGRTYIAPHWHRGIELSYVSTGEIDDFQIGKKHYHSYSGNILLVNSQQIHTIKNVSRKNDFALSIIFPYSMVYKYFPKIDRHDIQINDPSAFNERQRLAYAQLQGLLQKFMGIANTDTELKNLLLTDLSFQILLQLLTNFLAKEDKNALLSPKKTYIINRMQYITSYVNEHYQETLSLGLIARKCSISKEYLSRFFKKEMEMTVESYINNVRSQHVHEDLLERQGTLTEIALRNGFSGVRTMNRAFSKLYDISASDFRKKLNKKE